MSAPEQEMAPSSVGTQQATPSSSSSAPPPPPHKSLVCLTVPDGAAAGSFVHFAGPTGMRHSAMVPGGYTSGQTFNVEVEHGVVLQSQLVQVPEGGKAGDSVAFAGPCGQTRMARIPPGVPPLQAFLVQVPVPQPVPVVAHEGSTAGSEVMFVPPDGRPRMAVVPAGITAGQTFMAMVEPLPVAPIEPLAPADLEAWLNAARDFKMNADFEVPGAELLDKLDFPGLMSAMKKESDGKLTIQALSDKIMLSKMLDNLAMPQMPLLLAIQDVELISQEVQRFAKESAEEPGQDYIVKPTHLSNAEGVTTLSSLAEANDEQKADAAAFLEKHLATFMNTKAKEFESEALQSLNPGFIIQPKYKSSVGFHAPLELRIVTLWGKARMGVWWWGAPYTGTPAQRNAWVFRKPAQRGELSEHDQWEVAHEHPGHNPGFDAALHLFMSHMPQMAAASERLAAAVGAPFLRADFFVGDPKWGLRLNEVAYGSGTLHKRPSTSGGFILVDDSHAMAQILREGMSQCKLRAPAAEFLAPLGVTGSVYSEVSVTPAALEHPLRLPDKMMLQHPGHSEAEPMPEFAVPPEHCITPRAQWMPPGFVPCVNAPPSQNSAKGTAAVVPAAPKQKKKRAPKQVAEPSTWNPGAGLLSLIDRVADAAIARFAPQEKDQKSKAPKAKMTHRTRPQPDAQEQQPQMPAPAA